jgi:enoyl-CoA hydratase/carnithine racemase
MTQQQSRGHGFEGATLRLEWPRPHVAMVTFTRPAERNTLTLDFIAELVQVLELVRPLSPAALILTGSGSTFCAGADLKMLSSEESGLFRAPMAFRDRFLAPLAQLFDSLEEQPFPVIAAVNGHAIGGGFEMALSSDLRIASSNATFGVPEVKLGAIPGAGGVQKLARHVGRSKALEWILMGSRIPADEAHARGLLVEVVAPDQLLERALAMGDELATSGPKALAQAKASVYAAEDSDVRTARRFGVEALTALASTDEWREGVRAFAEKRAPDFRKRAGE